MESCLCKVTSKATVRTSKKMLEDFGTEAGCSLCVCLLIFCLNIMAKNPVLTLPLQVKLDLCVFRTWCKGSMLCLSPE